MKQFYSILFFLICFIIPTSLYADSENIDCQDLYGCKNTNEMQSNNINKSSKSTNTVNKNAGNKKPNTNTHNTQIRGSFIASGALPQLGSRKRGFLYSVVFLTALFDNGVQKQGYGVLLKDGYTLAAADLMTEKGAYLRSVTAKMQDDSSNSLMCFAMLRLRATDNKLSLLRAENYTDIYCNTRPESFYHQRINLHYFTPVYKGMLKKAILSRSDNVLFPFITENNTLHYRISSIANIQKHSAIYGLPLFNAQGGFVGFLYTLGDTKKHNTVISSDEVRNFICDVSKRRLLPISDLTRSCGVY